MMKIGNPFEEWFNFDVFDPIYKDYEVKVCVAPRVPPRDPMFEYVTNMGRGDMEQLFEKRQPLKTENALWVFPERWLAMAEQQLLMWTVDRLRGNIKSIHIVTQSPLIISDFTRGHVRIVATKADRDFSAHEKALKDKK